jgi:hypothetical protein
LYALTKKSLQRKRAILAAGLIVVVIVAIGAYYTVRGIGYASVQGIYIRMFGWTRCYSDAPSPHVNVTTNAVLLFSTHPAPFDTVVRSVKFTLTIDSLSIGIFQLPYDTYFTSDHESLPWLRYTVLNSTLAKAVVQSNSSYISLKMNAVAETIFYQQVVERYSSINVVWKPSILTSNPSCLDGYNSQNG